jgi:hypothetical protein
MSGSRQQAHEAAIWAVERELEIIGLKPRHTCTTHDLKSGQYQTYARRRMLGTDMPCDLVVRLNKRLIFIKAANVRTNFTSAHRFLAYINECGHDYLIVSTGEPVGEKLRAKFPQTIKAADEKPHVARIIHLSDLESVIGNLKRPQPKSATPQE